MHPQTLWVPISRECGKGRAESSEEGIQQRLPVSLSPFSSCCWWKRMEGNQKWDSFGLFVKCLLLPRHFLYLTWFNSMTVWQSGYYHTHVQTRKPKGLREYITCSSLRVLASVWAQRCLSVWSPPSCSLSTSCQVLGPAFRVNHCQVSRESCGWLQAIAQVNIKEELNFWELNLQKPMKPW